MDCLKEHAGGVFMKQKQLGWIRMYDTSKSRLSNQVLPGLPCRAGQSPTMVLIYGATHGRPPSPPVSAGAQTSQMGSMIAGCSLWPQQRR
jgi:hypothetical protein